MPEVANNVTMKGNPVTLTGNEVQIGKPAPDCELTANDLTGVALSSFKGKKLIILSVPSLDTPVCDKETRWFNDEASKVGDDVQIVAVSMDLPFAQKRWCAAQDIKNVTTLSDYREAAFGQAYGVLVKDLRLLARAVYIVDAEGTLRYKQLVGEITDEPNYDEVLEALKNL